MQCLPGSVFISCDWCLPALRYQVKYSDTNLSLEKHTRSLAEWCSGLTVLAVTGVAEELYLPEKALVWSHIRSPWTVCFMCMSAWPACMHAHHVCDAHGDHKRALDSLELDYKWLWAANGCWDLKLQFFCKGNRCTPLSRYSNSPSSKTPKHNLVEGYKHFFKKCLHLMFRKTSCDSAQGDA